MMRSVMAQGGSDKVRVAVRVRPFNNREIELDSHCVVDMADNQTILHPPPTLQRADEEEKFKMKTFAFDHCFWSIDQTNPKFASQHKVFECLGFEVLDSAFNGYNASVIAYGQTGSGKSYSMMGRSDPVEKGLIPRLCDSLFDRITNNSDATVSYKVEVSYMEIYNEKVHDLLDVHGSKKNLRVREHTSLGPYVDGLSQLVVSDYSDVDRLMNEGNKSRTVAMTNMNSESSRSHAVFTLILTQNLTDTVSAVSGERVSKMSLVDLAGSERAQKSGAVGERLREGASINKSLTTLMQVVSALADSSKSSKFIPYRDSVLTWLLKDNLGGNSKSVMVATLSPSADNYDETLSTLRYADRAKRIVNHAVINEDPNAKIIRELREEVEQLRNDLKSAKERQAPDLIEKLEESEKLMRNLNRTWEDKLLETERLHKERQESLEKLGISVETCGIKVESNQYFLVNLNADPSLNEMLVYYLKEDTKAGSDASQDIQLDGLGIKPEHCRFELRNNKVYIVPIEEARTLVNGKFITERRSIHHGDRILWGMNHFFRIHCPVNSTEEANEQHTEAAADYNFAQQEVMLAELQHDPIQQALKEMERQHASEKADALARQRLEYESKLEQLKMELTSPMTASMMSLPPSGVLDNSANLSAHEIEQERPISQEEEHIEDQMLKSCANRLREQVSRARLLTREANFLAADVGRLTDYSVTLQIPANNLSPNGNHGRIFSEPAILVRRENRPNQVWSMRKFENRIIDMREAYEERKQGGEEPGDELHLEPLRSPLDEEGNLTASMMVDKGEDPFFDAQETHSLIGVSNFYLNCLFHNIKFRYNAPILNQQGEITGKLLVDMWLVSGDLNSSSTAADNKPSPTTCSPLVEDNPYVPSPGPLPHSSSSVTIGIRIIQARDLPAELAHFVFCQYHFWGEREYTVAPPTLQPDFTKRQGQLVKVKFDHTAQFSVPVSEDVLEHIADDALSIEVYGNRAACTEQPIFNSNNHGEVSPHPETPLSPTNGNNSSLVDDSAETTVTKQQLANDVLRKFGDRWIELYRRLEFWVAIEELNDQGVYQKVEVTPTASQLTGGVYQLRHGQSRRLRVFVRANRVSRGGRGSLPLICDSIQQISVGSVLTKPHDQKPLDSYQEEDLNILRECWTEAVRRRQDYLHEQLEKIVNKPGKTSEEEERESCLMSQWLRMTAERDAVLVPAQGSGIPGAPAQWNPPPGMEKHSPVVFLNINGEALSPGSTDAVVLAGGHCLLNDERCEEFVQAPIVKVYENLTGAVGQWDSSLNNSIILNKVTPHNENVYLTVKVTVRLTHPFLVDLVLRKRICVNIYKKQGITKFLKKTITKYVTVESEQISWTGVTYQIVSGIPQASLDIEDRESLARMAASHGERSVSSADGESYFMKYMRSLYAVEKSLYHDRLRQVLAVKELALQQKKKAALQTNQALTSRLYGNSIYPNSATSSSLSDQAGGAPGGLKKFISVPNFQGMSRSFSLNSLNAITMSSLLLDEKSDSVVDLSEDKGSATTPSEDSNKDKKSTILRRPEPPKALLMRPNFLNLRPSRWTAVAAKNPLISPLQPCNASMSRLTRSYMGTVEEERNKHGFRTLVERENSESEDDSYATSARLDQNSDVTSCSRNNALVEPVSKPSTLSLIPDVVQEVNPTNEPINTHNSAVSENLNNSHIDDNVETAHAQQTDPSLDNQLANDVEILQKSEDFESNKELSSFEFNSQPIMNSTAYSIDETFITKENIIDDTSKIHITNCTSNSHHNLEPEVSKSEGEEVEVLNCTEDTSSKETINSTDVTKETNLDNSQEISNEFYLSKNSVEEIIPSKTEDLVEIIPPKPEYLEEIIPPKPEYLEEVIQQKPEDLEEVIPLKPESLEEIIPSKPENLEEIIPPKPEDLEEIIPPKPEDLEEIIPPKSEDLEEIIPPKTENIEEIIPPNSKDLEENILAKPEANDEKINNLVIKSEQVVEEIQDIQQPHISLIDDSLVDKSNNSQDLQSLKKETASEMSDETSEGNSSMSNSMMTASCSNFSLNDEWRDTIGFSCADLNSLASPAGVPGTSSPTGPPTQVLQELGGGGNGVGTAPSASKGIQVAVGDTVQVVSSSSATSGRLTGWVRYVGPTKFAPGLWVGVELELPEGKNDGAVKDTRYFRCKKQHGIFVRPEKLIVEKKKRRTKKAVMSTSMTKSARVNNTTRTGHL